MQRNKIRISLRWKALLGLIVPLTVLFLVLSFINEQYLIAKINNSHTLNTIRITKSFLAGYDQQEEGVALKQPQHLVDNLRQSDQMYERVVLFVSAGHTLLQVAESEKSPGHIKPDHFFRAPLKSNKLITRERGHQLEIAMPVDISGERAVLAVNVNLRERDVAIGNLKRRSLATIGLSVFALSLLIWSGLKHTFLDPLERLRSATSFGGDRQYIAPDTVWRQDEIGDLARSIDTMTTSLQKRSGSLQARVGELALLYDISGVATSTCDLNEGLTLILESAAKITHATSGFIMLTGDRDASGQLELETTHGLFSKTMVSDLVNVEIVESVVKNRSPLLLVGDITPIGLLEETGFKDAIYAPIIFDHEIAGVIGLVNKEPGDFNKKDLQLVLTLANQAAGVKKRANLFDDLQLSYIDTVRSLSATIVAKDPYTRNHSNRVAKYAVLIAENMGCQRKEKETINIAACLHDVGKIGIDENILHKPTKLAAEEFESVKQHTIISSEILKKAPFLKDATPIVRHHHERF
ncbi:MAG: HD domain-containing protein, partial [Actinomycetia bacterium]|nr:HD domain-containing protein [Actinomycetes bacterium]